jgi:hypothetical protein
MIVVVGIAAALMQVVGWYYNARRYAVGTTGPFVFFGSSEWKPALGWGAWLCVVLLGAGLIVTFSVVAARSVGQSLDPDEPHHSNNVRAGSDFGARPIPGSRPW